METKDRIFVALDVNKEALRLMLDQLADSVGGFKIGLRLATSVGIPYLMNEIGHNVFLDMKYHDIATTVEQAVEEAVKLQPKMLTVHTSGGSKMLDAAMVGAVRAKMNHRSSINTLVLGATVLSDQERRTSDEIGIDPRMSMEELVVSRAKLAYNAGLNGVVVPPLQISSVRTAISDKDFVIVVAGIRFAEEDKDDQVGTLPPGQAVDCGADYIVVGRPITRAPTPRIAVQRFIDDINQRKLKDVSCAQ